MSEGKLCNWCNERISDYRDSPLICSCCAYTYCGIACKVAEHLPSETWDSPEAKEIHAEAVAKEEEIK